MHKFMDADSIEYALRGALNGDTSLVEIAKRTLDAATALIDPVWGGVYQYSPPLREDNVLPGELPARLLTCLRPLA